MSIRGRFWKYCGMVTRGSVRPRQLTNFVRNRLAPKTEVMHAQPTHLSFFVTSRCNFRCDMCPTMSRKIPKDYAHRHHEAADMSVDLLRFVLDRYPNAIRVQLIGVGEPLLNPHLFDLLAECVKRRMIVDTVSNGLELDTYIVDILRSGLDRLCVSVNGHTAKEFHRMTGMPETCHSRILRNVEALVSARGHKKVQPGIEVSFIVDRVNHVHMLEMIGIGEQLGVDRVAFYNYLPSPYPGFTPEERCLYADDAAVREGFARLIPRKFRCDVTWPLLLGRPEQGWGVCRWPFSLLQVDGDGNVGGCSIMLLNMHENGNVKEGDAWNNEHLRDLRRRHLRGRVLWPCEYCGQRVGVDPIRIVECNSSIPHNRNRIANGKAAP
jgi:MoaA/NifB/PqqE/SkfB family radical SAM enzyme